MQAAQLIASSTNTLPQRPDAAAAAAPQPTVKMAQEFESLIISQLLKQMRSTGAEGGLFAGDKSDTYGGMFDMYFGQFLSENGGLGLADLVSQGIESEIGADNSQPATTIQDSGIQTERPGP